MAATCILQVESILESVEAKQLLSALPCDLLEAICCSVDLPLRRRLVQVIGNRQQLRYLSEEASSPFLLRALLSVNGDCALSRRLDIQPLPFEQRSPGRGDNRQEDAEDLVNRLLTAMAARNSTLMEASTADKYIAEVGRSLTSSAEKCENEIREFSRVIGMTGAKFVANLISAMCKSHFVSISVRYLVDVAV